MNVSLGNVNICIQQMGRDKTCIYEKKPKELIKWIFRTMVLCEKCKIWCYPCLRVHWLVKLFRASTLQSKCSSKNKAHYGCLFSQNCPYISRIIIYLQTKQLCTVHKTERFCPGYTETAAWMYNCYKNRIHSKNLIQQHQHIWRMDCKLL